MKKTAGIIVGLMLWGSSSLWADRLCDRCAQERQSRMVEKKIDRLTQKLKLSGEQQDVIRRILRSEAEKKAELKKEASMRLDALHEETQTEIKKTLASEQQSRFEAIWEQSQDKKAKGRRSCCHK
ncbi:MAG TPA: hypothetical protein P5079_07900 [Elusimicrobiota bacterium]|nr:hypothetical protein [Elusimicrobiota bacterium]